MSANEISASTFKIPEANLARLQEVLTKLQARAARLGLSRIDFAVTGSEDVAYIKYGDRARVRYEPRHGDLAKLELEQKIVYVRFHTVTVTGTTPRLAGWAFVATLQHLQGEDGETLNLLRIVPGAEASLPEKFRTASAENCDHCHKAIRTRKDTFIVHHEDGTWKQVGRNCTQDFLGGQDPKAVAQSLEIVLSAIRTAGEAESEGHGPREDDRISLRSFLAAAAACVRVDGWLSRAKARDLFQNTSLSTASQALKLFTPPAAEPELSQWKAWAKDRENVPADLELVEKAVAYAREVLSEKQDRSDYEHNLYVATVQASIDYKLAGIAASLIPFYQKEVERVAIREAEARQVGASTYIGNPGDKVFLDVQVTRVLPVGEDSQWGTSFLHTLVTVDGNAVVWFSSNAANNLKVGEVYTVAATVKKHDLRNGIKQTVVTRLAPVTKEYVAEQKLKAEKKAARAAKKAGSVG